jgi:hypothetical protein
VELGTCQACLGCAKLIVPQVIAILCL